MSRWSARQLRKLAMQRRATRRLPRVLANGGDVCHWCKVHLIMRRSPPAVIRYMTEEWVVWADPDLAGLLRRSYWATADHLTPLHMNGASTVDNLVPACGPCNRGRSAGYVNPTPDAPKWRGSSTCKCGRPKYPKHKKCAECTKLSKRFKALCIVTRIAKAPGPCTRCGTPVEPLEEIPGYGLFYGCPGPCRRRPLPTCSKPGSDS